jgi:hypothetical protein
VAVETSRGWRITKEKRPHKIDVVVALGQHRSALRKVPHGRDDEQAHGRYQS